MRKLLLWLRAGNSPEENGAESFIQTRTCHFETSVQRGSSRRSVLVLVANETPPKDLSERNQTDSPHSRQPDETKFETST